MEDGNMPGHGAYGQSGGRGVGGGAGGWMAGWER